MHNDKCDESHIILHNQKHLFKNVGSIVSKDHGSAYITRSSSPIRTSQAFSPTNTPSPH